ncbi:MAG TPA: amino acid permease, partial [Thermoanaerobaculia bacterium]|nr:amino acid permease [Thermoanaerobaculia bacterium]
MADFRGFRIVHTRARRGRLFPVWGFPLLRGIFKTKSLNAILASAEAPHTALNRSLGTLQLTLLGIGAIIGAGIFSTVGTAAAGGASHLGAGPGLVLSFVITAITCGFAALCYAEFASMVPVSGSAYTYSYATLGELVGWIIGWDLIIEYAVGNIAVAISWSGYFQELLRGFGLNWPGWLGTDYRTALQAAGQVAAARAEGTDPAALGLAVERGAQALAEAPRLFGMPLVFNVPAFLIVMLITVVLVVGIRESAWFNSSMVVLKLAIIAFFIGLGAFYVQPENWTPFAPNGFVGIAGAAAIIFFAYIGFDAVSTAAEETKDPGRSMPIAIIASLAVCTLIYIAVALVLTGMLPWTQLGTAEPLATAFSALGMGWPALIISLGAVFATTSVLVVFQLGQPRIFFSMARDGLLPSWAARVHPRYRTPHITTWITGIVVAFFAGVANINEVVELTNIGTLFAFLLVCVGITVLRYKDPDRPRRFRVPLGPWIIPMLGAASCIFLMVYLPPASWWRFIGWLVLGMAVYFAYGYSHSTVGREAGRSPRPRLPEKLAAAGFLSAGIGLFTIPHDAGLPRLLQEAATAGDPDHDRALVGLMLIAAGLVLVVIGAL